MVESKTFKLKDLADAYAGGSARARKRGRRRNDEALPLVFNGKLLSSYAKDDVPAEADQHTAGETPVITVRSLADISIDDSQVARHAMRREVPPDGLTEEGDVIVSLASPFPAACIDGDHVGYFVTNACAIIRLGGQAPSNVPSHMVLDPWFLAGYLNLSAVRSMLRSKTLGGRSPSLKIAQLEDIDIPIVEASRQRQLAEVARSYAECARARRRIDELQREAIESAFARSFGEVAEVRNGR